MESLLFCSQCGSKLAAGAKFCQGCGAQMANAGGSSPQEDAPSDAASSRPVAPEGVLHTVPDIPTPGPETKTDQTVRGISATTFGLCILLFLMPFLNVSCSGMAMERLSGLDLSLGTTMEIKEPFSGKVQKKKVNAEPLALLALAVAVSGITICIVARKHRVAFVNAPLGVLGFVLMLLLKNKLDGDVMREGGGLISINYEFAFWAVMGIFLAISMFNGFNIFAPRISEPASR